jgi:hypothetical protein
MNIKSTWQDRMLPIQIACYLVLVAAFALAPVFV